MPRSHFRGVLRSRPGKGRCPQMADARHLDKVPPADPHPARAVCREEGKGLT